MLVPAGHTEGIFPASLGLVKALNDNGVKAVLFNPFGGKCKDACDSENTISPCCAFKQIASGKKSEVLEAIVANYHKLLDESKAEIVVIEGICCAPFDKDELNADICHAMDADIITVTYGTCCKAQTGVDNTLLRFGNAGKNRVLGDIVVNKGAPRDACGRIKLVLSCCGCCCGEDKGKDEKCCCAQKEEPAITNVLATVPFDTEFFAPPAGALACCLDGTVTGDDKARGFKLVFDGDAVDERDVLVTRNVPAETKAAVVILTSGVTGEVKGCKAVITTAKSTLETVQALADLPPLPPPCCECKGKIAAATAGLFDRKVIDLLKNYDKKRVPLMSPAAFRYKLTALARAAHKRIALPEGNEPRTVVAASKVAAQKIAVPILFGKKDDILAVAKEKGVTLGEGVEFVDPDQVRDKYIDRLVELRQKKGMTPEKAVEMLKDNVALATMMIERGEIDGLVSGAVHTTANTIRPAFQILKTAPGAKLVSGGFFMLMPEQVFFYADCAVNLNPNPDELSEIAIQSADTAKAFGIEPRVAMVSYSTLGSGKGPDVDLVTAATELVRQKRPDILVDGPLQYDAAVMPNVAAQKAPGSKVAGKATVYIFPSLSCGNTVYKAVQRSAHLVSVGPLLQGLRKPVNDLSRGALVDDIVYTIAVTAVQATQVKG